jgi:hypothetical protein
MQTTRILPEEEHPHPLELRRVECVMNDEGERQRPLLRDDVEYKRSEHDRGIF